MNTSRVDGVKAPQHRGTPRSHVRRLQVAVDDALETDDGDALDVSFDALDMNMDAYDLGVPRCCGAFTPSTRVVSRRGGRGWSLFRV